MLRRPANKLHVSSATSDREYGVSRQNRRTVRTLPKLQREEKKAMYPL